MSIQLKKVHFGRRRFLKTDPLVNIEDWQLSISSLKSFVALHSGFQIVGGASTLECSQGKLCAMIEVLGVPQKIDQNALHLCDYEECDLLIHQLDDFDLFTLSFDKLMLLSASILKSTTLNGRALAKDFHLVFNQQKIELHFFSQKDYIQKQF